MKSKISKKYLFLFHGLNLRIVVPICGDIRSNNRHDKLKKFGLNSIVFPN
jgi:hypothetical protein